MNSNPTELQEQINLFEMIAMYETRYPQLKMISASMNGMHSNAIHVRNQKLAGLKPGYPDLILDYPSRGYHGARIELKRRDGGKGLSKDQIDWFKRLTDQGYWCHQANGWNDAWSSICWYLDINP